MAKDTSMLSEARGTPADVHQRVTAGESLESIAASFTYMNGQPLDVEAVQQFLDKVDEHGKTRTP